MQRMRWSRGRAWQPAVLVLAMLCLASVLLGGCGESGDADVSPIVGTWQQYGFLRIDGEVVAAKAAVDDTADAGADEASDVGADEAFNKEYAQTVAGYRLKIKRSGEVIYTVPGNTQLKGTCESVGGGEYLARVGFKGGKNQLRLKLSLQNEYLIAETLPPEESGDVSTGDPAAYVRRS